eukprot:835304-Prymnesium_polylepis.1
MHFRVFVFIFDEMADARFQRWGEARAGFEAKIECFAEVPTKFHLAITARGIGMIGHPLKSA